jgi:dTDP-4-amino-4,6-dideoxygalactose transaminase
MKRKTRPRIVGGMFGLEETSGPIDAKPPFLNSKVSFLLTNASSGIAFLIRLLSPAQVWLPSYLCDSMIDAVDKSIATVKFYEVDYNLALPSFEWTDGIRPNDLVVLIDYFGFSCNASCIARIKDQGAWVLEDACQSLLSREMGLFSDFVLYSPRKFLGVPDGGILASNHEIAFDTVKLQNPPTEWWLKAFSASVLRREFDLYDGNRRWFELFQETEDEAPIGPYAMSELSRMLLQHSFDYSMIAHKRVENYQLLADKLNHLALFPSLPPEVVPLGYPIRVKNRDRVRHALFDQKIYAPVHWAIEGIVPKKFKDSHRLAGDIMTLPCDQRYDSRDMKRMVRCVSEALK